MVDEIIPLITEPDSTFDFVNEEMVGDRRKYTSWFYVKKGIYVNHNYEVDKTIYNAIREDDTYGLLFWDTSKNSWRTFSEKVQNLYRNYKADKILLTDGE